MIEQGTAADQLRGLYEGVDAILDVCPHIHLTLPQLRTEGMVDINHTMQAAADFEMETDSNFVCGLVAAYMAEYTQTASELQGRSVVEVPDKAIFNLLAQLAHAMCAWELLFEVEGWSLPA